MKWLLAKLDDLQDLQALSMVKVAQVSQGVRNEFDTSKTTMEKEIEKVMYSITQHPDFDFTNPVQAACLGNQRSGTTASVFR